MLTSFDMSFAPHPRIVSVVRRFVLSLYERVLEGSDASAQMALATGELLENAVRYNIDNTTLLRVSLTRPEGAGARFMLTIRTRNRATRENILLASRTIARVRDTEDPFLLYQEMIQQSVASSEGSGLGLARIRAETEMTVDVRVDGDHIEIIAQLAKPQGGAP